MRFETSDGVSIAYAKRGGSEPTLVHLHGWANNRSVWKRIVQKLPYRQFAPDLRGHGRSGKPSDPDAYALERFSNDVRELLDAEGVERCVLVGHSMGGMIALSIDDPRIEGLVLLNTAPGIRERVRFGPNPLIKRIASRYEETRHQHVEDLADTYHNDFDTFLRGLSGTSLVATIRCFEEMYELDVADRLRELETPTLVVMGDQDRVLPPQYSRALKTIPKSRSVRIASHHFSLIDQAAAIARLIEGFVETL